MNIKRVAVWSLVSTVFTLGLLLFLDSGTHGLKANLQHSRKADPSASLPPEGLADLKKAKDLIEEWGKNRSGRDPHVAEQKLREAYRIQTQWLDEDHPLAANTKLELAFVLMTYSHRYAEAEVLCRAVLAANQNPDTELGSLPYADQYAGAQILLGECLGGQGKYYAAESAAKEAIRVQEKAHGGAFSRRLHEAYTSLAGHLGKQGDFERSTEAFRKALDLCTDYLGENDRGTAQTLLGFAALKIQMNDLQEAVRLSHRTHNILFTLQDRSPGDPELRMWTVGNSLAVSECKFRLGDFQGAEVSSREALQGLEKIVGMPFIRSAALQSLALILHSQEKYDEAEALYLAALEISEPLRIRMGGRGKTRTVVTGLLVTPSRTGLAILRARRGQLHEAWACFEKGRARWLVDDILGADANPLTQGEESDRHKLEEQLYGLDERMSVLRGVNFPDKNRNVALYNLALKRENLLASVLQLNTRIRKKYGPIVGEAYDLKRIQANLAPDEAIVACVQSPANALQIAPWLCVVTKSGSPAWIELSAATGSGLFMANGFHTDNVAKTTKQAGENAIDKWIEEVIDVHRACFDALSKHFAEKTPSQAIKHLIVIPSRQFARLPLGIMSEKFTVSYSPSATLFAWVNEKGGFNYDDSNRSLLAVGLSNSYSGEFAEVGFGLLPGAEREVRKISELFSETDDTVNQPEIVDSDGYIHHLVLTGTDANEGKLDELAHQDQLRNYRYLHFATHGDINNARPMESSIILSSPPLAGQAKRVVEGKPIYDGRITVAQILSTWKLNAELVTLSACGTGLGSTDASEGLVGFSQAFLLAGARSVVVTLSDVDDIATELLMGRFYENLLGKRRGLDTPMTKAAALHESKQWLRQLTAEQVMELTGNQSSFDRGLVRKLSSETSDHNTFPFAHPRYWAPFILIGDPT